MFVFQKSTAYAASINLPACLPAGSQIANPDNYRESIPETTNKQTTTLIAAEPAYIVIAIVQ